MLARRVSWLGADRVSRLLSDRSAKRQLVSLGCVDKHGGGRLLGNDRLLVLAITATASYMKVVKLKIATIDDMAVPRLSYHDGYAQENKKFNLILLSGSLVFAATASYMYYYDILDLEKKLPPKSYRNREIHPVAVTDGERTLSKKLLEKKDSVTIPVIRTLVTPPASGIGTTSDTIEPPKQPTASAHLPRHVPYLLIGAGTASAAAAKVIREEDPDAKVLIIGDELQYPYKRPPLSKVLWWAADARLVQQLRFQSPAGKQMSISLDPGCSYSDPAQLSKKPGVAVAVGRRVVKLDVQAHEAILDDDTKIKYDKCLIATGGKPRRLHMLEHVSTEIQKRFSVFRTASDFLELEKLSRKVDSITVVGGGVLGTELACALREHGAERDLEVIHLISHEGVVPSVLPRNLSKWAVEYMKSQGIYVRPVSLVTDAQLRGRRIDVTVNDGAQITTDHVVTTIGLEPNVDVAQQSGLPLDSKNGGINSDTELRCAPDVYCAGDCCSYYDFKSGYRRIEHHDNAASSGAVAGGNMVGLTRAYSYVPVYGSGFGHKVTYMAVGDADSSLLTVGAFKTKSGVQRMTSGTSDVSFLTENDKGVVLYLRHNLVVGMLLWNMPDELQTALKILKSDDDTMREPENVIGSFDLLARVSKK